MDGISIVPTLRDQPDVQGEHDYLYWEFHERGGKQAVRLDRFKAIRLKVNEDPRGPIQLYDLDADPGETVDVAAEHPEVIERMVQAMTASHVPSERFRFGAKQ